MGFLLQLKLLLWKNFTLRKRKPVMLVLEVTIPLVLFFILIGIRHKRPEVQYPAENFPTWPLPSAGLISILQSFCSDDTFDTHGFPIFPKATVTNLLTELKTLAENNNFFQPEFSLEELSEIPENYKRFVEDPLMIRDILLTNHSMKWRVSNLLRNPVVTEKYLVQNKSLNPLGVNFFFYNTTINRKVLFQLLFSSPRSSGIFSEDINLNSISDASDGQLLQVLQQDTFREIFQKFTRRSEPVFQLPELFEALKVILFDVNFLEQYICRNSSFTVESFIQCDAMERTAKRKCEEELFLLKLRYCRLNEKDLADIREVLMPEINTQKAADSVDGKRWNSESIRNRTRKLDAHLKTFMIFKRTVGSLAKVADVLPQEDCDSKLDKNVGNQVGNKHLIRNEGTHSSADTSHEHDGNNVHDLNNSTSERKLKVKQFTLPNAFSKIWKSLQKTVCGKDYKYDADKVGSLNDMGLTSGQIRKIGILFHMLYTNPKILYAPTGTAADAIIKEANHTFEFFNTMNGYATLLLEVGLEMKEYLSRESTNQNLKILSRIQKHLRTSPLLSLLEEESSVQDFIRDVDVMDRDSFVSDLDSISLAACSWNKLLDGINVNIFLGFPTEDALIDYFQNIAYSENSTVLAGVIFQMNDDGSLPNHMIYKIRQNATLVQDTTRVRARFWFPGPNTCCYQYYQFGFVWVQDILERAMINLYSEKNVSSPGSYFQQFPYPCYTKDTFLFMIQHVMPLCLTISWVYSVAMLVQHIVYEKEQRLKEFMKMMGLQNGVHWIAWFISAITQMTVSVAFLTLLLKYGNILKYSNLWLIFLTIEAYAVTIIMFSFLMSVLYSKAKIAAACAGIVYFMSYIPYMYISVREETANEVVPSWIKATASLLAPTAFGLGAKYFALYEVIGIGIQLSNYSKSPAEDDDFNLFHVVMMLGIDSLIYGFFVWYIENVHPGAIGIPKPWYFPFQKSYWFGKFRTDEIQDGNPLIEKSKWWTLCRKPPKLPEAEQEQGAPMLSLNTSSELFEQDPENLQLGVSINQLSKRYKGSVKYALKNFTMNFYEGQITALCGHNGTGKTTAISILTGLFPATSGSATIYNLDIGQKMDAIRNVIGVGMCPQHNVLFEDLTVDEHMWFYSRLKGHHKDDFDAETEELISELKLPDKRNQKVDVLSGGMKRKLSVAIAFVGGSRTVILDEPTAGVDPYARRAIWDLIIKCKKSRTIMLTTHHMDEADILGDRVAIMADSKVICCGSPLYLKHHLGRGYHLSIVKKINDSPAHSDFRGIKDQVTKFITHIVPTAKFTKESKHELHYILPFPELRVGNFERLFAELEEAKNDLLISSYGIKSSTLEEIFLRAIEHQGCLTEYSMSDTESEVESTLGLEMEFQEDEINLNVRNEIDGTVKPTQSTDGHVESTVRGSATLFGKNDTNIKEQSTPQPHLPSYEGAGKHKIEGNLLLLHQFIAIIRKRYACTLKNIEGLFTQILLPAFFIATAMIVALSEPKVTDLPELILSPSQYYNLTQPSGNIISFANVYKDARVSDEPTAEDILRTIYLPSGVGATCVLLLKYPFAAPFHMNFSGLNANLQASYFDNMCQHVFQPRVPLANFVPVAPTVTLEEVNLTEAGQTTFPPTLHQRKYPICTCNSAKTGFVCPAYGYVEPDSIRVVTSDVLIDISGQNESQYYLYTTNMHRLRRYGGLSLGHVRGMIPVEFGRNAPTFFRSIAVRHAAKIWFSNKGYHSMPTYLNVMNNAILRANLPSKKGSPAAYGITLINHPFPDTRSYFSYDEILQGNDVLIAVFIIVAMSFVPASFVLYLVYEKSNKSKHLQIISGVHRGIYWVANYVWDICSYTVPAAFCILILLIFAIPAYTSQKNFPAVVSLFMMYGWSIAPVMYLASFFFNEPSLAYISMIVFNLFVGITCLVTSFLLEVFSYDPFLAQVYGYLKVILLIFPNYCLGRGLMDIAFNEYYNVFYQKSGQFHKIRSPFAWELVTRNLVIMAVTGVIFFVITLLCEFKVFRVNGCFPTTLRNLSEKEKEDDEDVAIETKRVLKGPIAGNILNIQNLNKVYHTRRIGNITAVDRLCLGVPPGECFGLLGVNGAGKSSTFRMLTGDTAITSGDALIHGHSVKNEKSLTHKFIGYCPQFDALYEELSPKEHLALYARLRGVSRKETDDVVDWALNKLGLMNDANRPAGTLSGGNRRKISTAIALIGGPSLIFLDEPTTGMDPHSKRFLWDLIQSLVREGRSLVFTSHSMEECEALCTRLAIMVNGQFRCLGSCQHLKNRFGDGYSVVLKSKADHDTIRLHKYFRRAFPNAKLKERHHNSLHYELKSQYVQLDKIFEKLESAMGDVPIQDYSVSQNTLDNVFINFVKSQNDYCEEEREESTEHRRNFSDMSYQIQLDIPVQNECNNVGGNTNL